MVLACGGGGGGGHGFGDVGGDASDVDLGGDLADGNDGGADAADDALPDHSANRAMMPPDRRVTGFIVGDLVAPVALPGARVWLVDSQGEPTGAEATTDVAGFFEIPPSPPGAYTVCAEAPGFEVGCTDEPVVLEADTLHETAELKLAPAGRVIFGSLLLADGTPCFQSHDDFETELIGSVAGGDGSSAAVNREGRFVLPVVGDQVTLTGSCQELVVEREVTVTDEIGAGREIVALAIENRAPRVMGVSLASGGAPRQQFAPGDVVDVRVDATDADGDRLQYRWLVDGGTIEPLEPGLARWTLMTMEARNILTVQVRDGRGGYAYDGTSVGTSPGFAHRLVVAGVEDTEGQPLDDATIRVNGATLASEDGHTTMVLPADQRSVITVNRPGFAPWSEVLMGGRAEVTAVLARTQQTDIDPTVANDVDAPGGARLSIPAGALLNEEGEPPTGMLTLYVHQYPEADRPGDNAGEDTNGDAVSLDHLTVFSLEARDADGASYTPRPDGPVTMTFPAPPERVERLPAQISVARYDEGRGVYVERGTANLMRGEPNVYVAELGSFSIWSLAQNIFGNSCVRVRLSHYLPKPTRVRLSWWVPYGFKPAQTHTFTQTAQFYALTGLPNEALVLAELLSKTGKVITSDDVIVNGDAGMLSWPYAQCQEVLLAPPLPKGKWFDRYEGNKDMTLQYYQDIGALPAKDTLAKWRAANDFDTPTEDEIWGRPTVAYYNPNELGVGRRGECRHSIGSNTVACSIQKFGDPHDSPASILYDTINVLNPGDTVTMEYSPAPTSSGQNIVKFYIYGPDGHIKPYTYFDPSGRKLYAPQVCNHCHWGTFNPFDVNYYVFPSTGSHRREAQEEGMRQVNASANYVFQHHAVSQKVGRQDWLEQWYAGQVYMPGTAAAQLETLPLPSSWQDAGDYYDLVRPDCRGCHIAWGTDNTGFSFGDGEFSKGGAGTSHVCSGEMPQAFAPALRLWTEDAGLRNDFWGSCAFTPSARNTPRVKIVNPTSGSLPYGALAFEEFRAVAETDLDGDNCCDVTWQSNVDGLLGRGKSIEYVFTTPGPRTVTVTAVSPAGHVATDSIDLNLVNDPPTVEITLPNRDEYFTGGMYSFAATASDRNQLGIACDDHVWTSRLLSSNQVEPGWPQTGCELNHAFDTAGLREVEVVVTDGAGESAADSITLDVQQQRLNGPPQITGFNPPPNHLALRDDVFALRVFFTEPDGDPVTVEWYNLNDPECSRFCLPFARGQQILANAHELAQGRCGPVSVTLRVRVFDADGADESMYIFQVRYEPC